MSRTVYSVSAFSREVRNLLESRYSEIWLEGDHYKWRAMRANGEAEARVTGGASAKEKSPAWARTVPHTLGDPLQHLSTLVLSRHFRLDPLLN